MLWAIAFGTPFFLVFGWLSDKIGRKWIMMTGMLLGVLLYRPIFSSFLNSTNAKEWMNDKANLIYKADKKTTTDTVAEQKKLTLVTRTESHLIYKENTFTEKRTDTIGATGDWVFLQEERNPLLLPVPKEDQHPQYSSIKLSSSLKWKFIFLVWVMIVLVTMVYGPIAAFLVEMFPTKIRYTSMSLPYHIGNGVFGGLVPFIGLLLTTTYPSDPLVGLNYPIGVAALCFIIGTIYLSNKIDKDVQD